MTNLGLLYVSNPEEIENENNILVENRLYNISQLVPPGTERDAKDFASDILHIIKMADTLNYDSLVLSKEEVDYNYYEIFLTGKRMETDEEKEIRLNNIKMRNDYVESVNQEIQKQILKPINILEFPNHSPRAAENSVFWFDDKGIGMFKIKFTSPTKFEEFCTKLTRIKEVYNPKSSVYLIHELLDEELRKKQRLQLLEKMGKINV